MVIKPDAIKQILNVNILKDLEDRGFNVVKHKLCRLNETQAGELYQEKKDFNYYPLLKKHMASGQSLCLILKMNGQDVVEKSKEYRDWARKNLKVKRFDVGKEDLDLLSKGIHPNQIEITKEMALENLIHISDDFIQDTDILGELFTQWDMDELKDRDLELFSILSEAKIRSRKSREIEISHQALENE